MTNQTEADTVESGSSEEASGEATQGMLGRSPSKLNEVERRRVIASDSEAIWHKQIVSLRLSSGARDYAPLDFACTEFV